MKYVKTRLSVHSWECAHVWMGIVSRSVATSSTAAASATAGHGNVRASEHECERARVT